MKAIYFENHGDENVLRYGDLPDPIPAKGEALIKVLAVSLNHLDIWVRRGWAGLSLSMPHVGGSDIVGEVVEVNGMSPVATGSRVKIDPALVTVQDEWVRRGNHSVSPGYKILGEHRSGGMAELVCVPVENVHPAEADIEDAPLAASLLVGTTCWRMIFVQGALRAGQSALIVGAGGGVNSLAIKLAAHAGATVIALTSTREKEEKAADLGAHHVVNYRDQPEWHKEILRLTRGRGVDLVVDNVGAATFEKSLKSVTRGGRIVTVGNTSGYNITFDNRLLFSKQISLIGSTMGSAQDFHSSQHFIYNKKLYPPVDTVAPLSEGIEMIKRLERGEQFGKIVLRP